MKKKFEKIRHVYKNANVALRASLWFAICSIVQKGISVITLPIFTRIMSTDEYGVYSVFLTWYNILIIIITLNIQADIFNKGLIDHQYEKDDYTSSQVGLICVLTTIFLILYLIFHKFFNILLGLSTGLVVIMIFEIFSNAIIGLWSARKRFDFDYVKIVLITVSMSIINPIVGVVAVLMSSQKAEARIVSNAIVPIVFSVFLLIGMTRRRNPFKRTEWWKPVVKASIPLLPHYLSLVLLNQSDKLMINYFDGPTDAAFYSIAHSAGLLMTIINTSINGAFVPWAYDKMKNKNGEGVKKISSLLLLLIMFVNVGVIWLAPEVIKILAAPQYAVAVWCLVPISMSVFFFFAYTLFVDIEIYYGANNYIAIASIIAACLNLVLNYFFIPIYGYIAAGYTTLISYISTMLLHYMFLRKTLKKNKFEGELFDLRVLFVLSILLCILSILAMFLYNKMLIRISIVAIAVIIVVIKRKSIGEIVKLLKNSEKQSQ